ncbi:23S rRNA (pseudouridine(1915)-N(3))-methyltransferase RlmH [Segatella salivae]|uniref:23S rRNA (pseudouridine(1915)-N(3))-methyltransferase RlmH n=1 Tax=Segatella salivae TaxID=228604 RepID=UPI0028DBF9C4|nr:23S rRNA (pseudouridine(1915)-N(3))-methyltransferase RlmH [Segatella salivae]
MKTLLILVGKTINKHFIAGINDYRERIEHYMPFDITVIPELKNTKKLSNEQQKEREGELILSYLKPADTVVLLDEHGKEFRSIEFAEWLQKEQHTARRLVFVIGGPYGFSAAMYQRANEKLSLSRMTFSHQMVRLIFTEQLYRACTIIKGEPYHHE